jgi:hypothetical protein
VTLRDLIDSKASLGDLSAILRRVGNPDQAMVGVDVARGVVPGRPHQSLSGLDPASLAIMDRLAWGQQNREHYGAVPSIMAGLATIAPYEAVKAAAQSGVPIVAPAGRAALRGAGTLFDLMGGKGDEMELGPNTSPASLANILAYMYGAAGGGR